MLDANNGPESFRDIYLNIARGAIDPPVELGRCKRRSVLFSGKVCDFHMLICS
jgi:hypothetical protein